MKLAATVLAGAVGLTACQPDRASSALQGMINVAVDARGNITLNGEHVTEEQVKAHLENGTASLLAEKDAAGQILVTVNGQKMTEEEFAALRQGSQQR